MKTITTTITAVLAFAIVAGAAEKQDGENGRRMGQRGEGIKELAKFRHEQRKAVVAHHKEQHKENEAHRESLKDAEPVEMCKSIKSHRATQHGENVTFHTGIYNDLVAFVKGLAGEDGVPQEKVDEMLAKIAEKHQEGQARHEEISKAFSALMDELIAKEDLTREDIKTALKAFHEKYGRDDRERRGRGRGHGRTKKGKEK